MHCFKVTIHSGGFNLPPITCWAVLSYFMYAWEKCGSHTVRISNADHYFYAGEHTNANIQLIGLTLYIWKVTWPIVTWLHRQRMKEHSFINTRDVGLAIELIVACIAIEDCCYIIFYGITPPADQHKVFILLWNVTVLMKASSDALIFRWNTSSRAVRSFWLWCSFTDGRNSSHDIIVSHILAAYQLWYCYTEPSHTV